MACWSRSVLQHAGVGRVAGLALAHRLQAEGREQHFGELLRRADGEVGAGQRDDAVAHLVDAVAQARRDLAEPVHVDGHADRLHGGQHAHQGQFDGAVQRVDAELGEAQALLGSEAPGEHRPGGGQGFVTRAFGDGLVIDARQLEQVVLGPFGGQQVAGDVGVEGGVGRRAGEARQRFGVVRHHVGGVTPQASPVVGAGDGGGDGRVAAVVDGGDRAVALARRDHSERRVAALQQGFEGVGAVGQAHLGKVGGERRAGGLGSGGGRAREVAHAAHEACELEALEELLDLASRQRVPGARHHLHDVLVERHVEHHAGEPLGQARRRFVLGQQRTALVGAHLGEVLVEVLDRAELLHQRGRRLLADAGDAGDVVGAVALEADVVGDLRRRHAEALDHAGRRVDLDVGHAAPGGDHPDVVVDDLQRVAVAGDHERAAALPLGLFGQCAEDVVGLVARLDQVGYAEGVHEAGQVGPLSRERVGHRRPLRLVAVELVVAKGLLAGVPGHGDGRRLEVADQLEEHLGEAVDGVGRKALARGDAFGQGKVRPVGEAGAVDENEAVFDRGLVHESILQRTTAPPGRRGRMPGARRQSLLPERRRRSRAAA